MTNHLRICIRPGRRFQPASGRWPVRYRPVLRICLAAAAIGVIAAAALQPADPRAAALFVAPSQLGTQAGRSSTDQRQQATREAAVRAMRTAMRLLAEAGHVPPGSDDPNHTGLVGMEWSDITSTLGDLEAKRTALSPLWAAVAVDELRAAGVKAGDVVAVSLSGSFPGLNIAVLAAAQALDLQVRAVASSAASMYGANRPQWAWPDMMKALAAAGWLQKVDWAVTLGGGDDMGTGLLSGTPELLQAIANRSGAPVLHGASLEQMIEQRWLFYHQSGKVSGRVAAFVNVGGGHAAMGDCAPPPSWNGRLQKSWTCQGVPGLLWRFQQSGVPTLHFLNIKELALRHGLPIDPVPLPGWNDTTAGDIASTTAVGASAADKAANTAGVTVTARETHP